MTRQRIEHLQEHCQQIGIKESRINLIDGGHRTKVELFSDSPSTIDFTLTLLYKYTFAALRP